MKRFAITLLACCWLVSCGKDVEPESVLEGAVITDFKIEGRLNGADYDIVGKIDQTSRTITLDRTIYANSSLIPTVKATGIVYYRGQRCAGTVPLDFTEAVALLVVGYDGSSATYTVIATIDPISPGEGSDDNKITSYKLELLHNSSAITSPCVINHEKGTVTVLPSTTAWIDNITEARAVFASEGVRVTAGGKEQESGISANDFSRGVEYTVTSQSGKTRTYTVSVVCPQSTGLPVIRVVTDNRQGISSKTTYSASTVWLDDYASPGYNIASARAGIRGRGNSTWSYSKKPYRVRFDDKTSVLGHGKARSWVLLANWQDPTYLMNTVAFEIARRLEIPYTNHAEHVELYLNGAYQGAYVLSEQVQAGTNRVNIDEDNDLLIELDIYSDPDKIYSAQGMHINIKSPDLDEMTAAQKQQAKAKAKSAYEEMESRVLNSSFPNTGWRDYVDVPSLIDYLLVYEVTRNGELGHPKSCYLWRRAGGKWTWGPVWDFDWGYGYNGGQTYWYYAESWIYAGNADSSVGSILFNRFFKDPQFKAEYKARWNQIKPLISDIDVFVGGMGEMLALSDVQNKRVWGGQYKLDYSGQIKKMQTWLNQRIVYLDRAINNL